MGRWSARFSNMKETWLPIKGFEGSYEISSHGRVKSLSRVVRHYSGSDKITNEKILKPSICGSRKNNLYVRVVLCVNRNLKTFLIHRLIGEAFIPNPKNLPCLNHKDKNGLNNKVENLEWVSARENMCHRTLGRKKFSKYLGVHRAEKGRWSASIYINKKSIYLGHFDDEKEAGKAYTRALKQHNISNKYAKL